MADETVEQLYQKIGASALEFADDLDGRLLIFADVEQDAISADMTYETGAPKLRFRFCPEPMVKDIYALWEAWAQVPGNTIWQELCLFIDGDDFKIDFAYPAQLDPEEGVTDRRPRAVVRYFGKRDVDYSRRN